MFKICCLDIFYKEKMAILQCVNVGFIAKNVSWKSLNFMLEISFNNLGCEQDKKSERCYF
jgi:hypothetical protein